MYIVESGSHTESGGRAVIFAAMQRYERHLLMYPLAALQTAVHGPDCGLRFWQAQNVLGPTALHAP